MVSATVRYSIMHKRYGQPEQKKNHEAEKLGEFHGSFITFTLSAI